MFQLDGVDERIGEEHIEHHLFVDMTSPICFLSFLTSKNSRVIACERASSCASLKEAKIEMVCKNSLRSMDLIATVVLSLRDLTSPMKVLTRLLLLPLDIEIIESDIFSSGAACACKR